MTGVTFYSLVPLTILLAVVGTGLILAAYANYQKSRTSGLRVLVLVVLALAVLDPRANIENRRPLNDVAVLVVDESLSQQLGDRLSRTASTTEAVKQALGRLDALDVRIVRVSPRGSGPRTDRVRAGGDRYKVRSVRSASVRQL